VKTHRMGSLITLMTAAALFLAACQPAAADSGNPPTQPGGEVSQPAVAGTEAPAPESAETTTPEESPATGQSSGGSATAEPGVESIVLPPAEVQVPQGWLSITNSSSGYSLAYPPEWEICTEQQHSLILCESQAEPSEMGLPLRMYISVFPHNYSNADSDVYNFFPLETIQAFASLAVGQSALKYPGGILPEYMTFTRLPDVPLDGGLALPVESSKVWEFPPETRERVVILDSPETTYIFGMYYQAPEQLELFEQVLGNVKILP
jgi:hypothetical protein